MSNAQYISPGTDLGKIIRDQGDDLTLNLSPGSYTIPTNIKNRKNIQILGQVGTIISVAKDNGVTLNSSDDIRFVGITFDRCGENGIYAETCEGLTFESCVFSRCQHSGLLTAYCDGVQVLKCLAFDTVEQHGIYLSSSGDDYLIDGCKSHNNNRFGVQVNSVDRRKPRISKTVKITRCELSSNGQGDLQLAGVIRAVIQGNTMHDSPKCMTLWDDDEGKKFATLDSDISDNTFRNSPIGVQIRNHSKGNRVRNNTFEGITNPLDAKKIKTQWEGNRVTR